jgi:N utilization substance protein B
MLTRRSRAREVALQLLFQKDQNPKPVPRADVERFARERLLEDAELTAYCLSLVDGVANRQAEIDPKISAVAENWRLTRMLPVDRNVLRLGAFELLFDPESQPVAVVIDEAIELARRYGSEDSPKFVNGILDKLSKLRKLPAEMSASTTSEREGEAPAEPGIATDTPNSARQEPRTPGGIAESPS